MVFAIPSLGRSETISSQTIDTLLRGGIEEDMIHVFVASEEESISYKKSLPSKVNVALGELGVGNQRTFINGYFQEGTRIVVMDDDVQIVVKEERKTKILDTPLFPLVEKSFDLCDELGARMWSVCNTTNGFFMSHQCVFGLRSCYGAFHGEYSKDPATQSRLPHSEDCEKGLKHFLEYGGFVRLNDVGVKQKRYSQGGVNLNLGGEDGRMAAYRETAQYLMDKYPELVKPSGKKDPKKGLLRVSNKTVSRHPSVLS